MSIATVITEGFGSFGDVAHVVTQGFDIGAASTTPADATILTQAFGALTAASAFIVTEGFRSGTSTPTPTPTGQPGGSFEVPHWDWLESVYQTAEEQAIEVLERARKRLEARGYYDS